MALRTSPFRCALALSGLAVLACATTARADEAFLCGPNTVVYVKPDELEQKKKTDKCVASFFGLEAEAANATAVKPRAGSKEGAASDGAGALAKTTLSDPEKSEPLTDAPARTAELGAAGASPGTDYRNVRVINASSPSDQWFKHTR